MMIVGGVALFANHHRSESTTCSYAVLSIPKCTVTNNDGQAIKLNDQITTRRIQSTRMERAPLPCLLHRSLEDTGGVGPVIGDGGAYI